MKNSAGLLRVLLVALAIPAIGFAISFFILSDMSKDLQMEEFPNVTVFCDAVRIVQTTKEVPGDILDACQEVGNIELLGEASLIAGGVGIFIPIMYWLASVFAGESRKRIAAIFPPIVKLFDVPAGIVTLEPTVV